jgi:hypothetical protein
MPTLGRLSLLVLWSAGSGVVLLLSLVVTSPAKIGPIGVTLWFVLLLLNLSGLLTLGLYALKSFLRVHTAGSERLRYSSRQGLLLAGWVTSVLALSSLRQFNLRDAILLGLLLAIVELYVRFRWP